MQDILLRWSQTVQSPVCTACTIFLSSLDGPPWRLEVSWRGNTCISKFWPVLRSATPTPLPPDEARVNVEVELLAQVGHVSSQGVQVHYHWIPALHDDNSHGQFAHPFIWHQYFFDLPLPTKVAVCCDRSPVCIVCQFWHPLWLPRWLHFIYLWNIWHKYQWVSRQFGIRMICRQDCEAQR